MKLSEITGISEAAPKVRKMSAPDLSAHYEKIKKEFETGKSNYTQQQIDGAKAKADEAWDLASRAKEKNLIDVHGAEWWELAKKQYPITKADNGDYVVKSNFALDPDAGVRGPWPFDSEGQAKDKVVKLVAWLDGGRKKGYGDKDADIQKWFSKLDAVDKAKTE